MCTIQKAKGRQPEGRNQLHDPTIKIEYSASFYFRGEARRSNQLMATIETILKYLMLIPTNDPGNSDSLSVVPIVSLMLR